MNFEEICKKGEDQLLKNDPKGALKTFEKALKRDSSLIDAYVGMGKALSIMGQYQLAIKTVQDGLERNPYSIEGLLELAIIYYKVSKFSNALDTVEKVLENSPNHIIALREKVKVCYLLGKFQDALDCCNLILNIDENDDFAMNHRNKVLKAMSEKQLVLIEKYKDLRRKGNFKEALRFLDELEIPEKASDIWIDKGVVHTEMNESVQAFFCFNEALRHDPMNFNAWMNIASLYLKQGKYVSAFEFFNEALKINPQDHKARQLQEISFRKSRNEQDNETQKLKESLKHHPEEAIEYFKKGTQMEQTGNINEAFKFYGKALKLDPTFAEAWYGKANLFIALQKYKDAILCLFEVIKINPDVPLLLIDTLNNKGICHRKVGEPKKALECYIKITEIDPSVGDAWTNIGNLYLDQKENLKAIEYFDIAIEAGSDQSGYSIIARNSKAKALLQLGAYEEALRKYNEILNYHPVFTPSLIGKGVALYELGNYDQSIEFLDAAIKIEPGNILAWASIANSFYEVEEYEKSLECFNEVLRIDPNYLSEDDRDKLQELKKKRDDNHITQALK